MTVPFSQTYQQTNKHNHSLAQFLSTIFQLLCTSLEGVSHQLDTWWLAPGEVPCLSVEVVIIG